jgi:hypothetical protein
MVVSPDRFVRMITARSAWRLKLGGGRGVTALVRPRMAFRKIACGFTWV